jgi:hypothetical protein
LFLRDPDLLYLSTPDAGSLNGILLVNDYPLLQQNQLWSRASSEKDALEEKHRNSLVTFSSAGQEAQYNAFLRMLEKAESRDLSASLLEWNWPAGQPRPNEPGVVPTHERPLWLTTIGTTGHFPLAILNDQSIDQGSLNLRTLEVGRPSHASMILWICFAMLASLHMLGLSFPNALPRSLASDFDLGDTSDPLITSKALCHLLILATLGLVQVILGSSYVYFRHYLPIYHWLAWLVFLISLAIVATSAVVVATGVVLPWKHSLVQDPFRKKKRVSIARPLIGGAICLLTFGGVGALWTLSVFQNKFTSAFLQFRDLKPGSSVAPCLPMALLLLVTYLGAWAYLRRITCWGHWRPPLPRLNLDEVFPSNFEKRAGGIDKCIVAFLATPGWTVAFLFLFGLGLLSFLLRANMELMEAAPVRWAAKILLGLAFFTLTLNWFRFINIWFLLRSILNGLERLPIRHAFERMPREKSMPIWQWGSDYSTLASTEGVERLRALLQIDATVVDPISVADVKSRIAALGRFESRTKGIWTLLAAPLRKPQPELMELPQAVGGARMLVSVQGSGYWNDVPVTDRLGRMLIEARDSMIVVVDQLIEFLSADYWRRGSDGSEDDPSEDKKVPKPELRIFWLAEDLVALRYYMYIRYVVTELRSLLFCVVLAFTLLFLAFHTYTFRADQAIDWSFLVLFLTLGGGVTMVLYQMELDPILSHLGGGKPGEVGLSFYVDLLKYGALPVLTIISSQVPAVSNVLLKWVQPAVQSLH